MNHSKAFWAVRNVYADWMRQLWARGYTGEGLWGRGRHLGTGKFTVNTTLPEEPLPKHLCGGTYESRGSRRHHRTKTTKEPLTYQQRKERRILNKFGANGVTLGSDPSTKVKLENGRLIKAAPRVAQSARGRELRAAAAIARFEQQKEEEARALEWFKKQKEESDARSSESGSSKGKEPAKRAERYDDDDSSTQSDYDEDDNGIVDSRAAAIDIDGSAMTDKDGKDLVRVCGDEEFGSDAVQETRDELRELQSSIREFFKPLAGPAGGDKKRKPELSASTAASSSGVGSRAPPTAPSQPTPAAARSPRSPEPKRTRAGSPILISSSSPSPATKQPPPPGSGSAPVLRLRTRGQMVPEPLPAPDIPKLSCPVCSFENELTDVACGACGNVLDPDGMPGAWRCGSEYCRKTQSQYVHARDVEACVVCGRVA